MARSRIISLLLTLCLLLSLTLPAFGTQEQELSAPAEALTEQKLPTEPEEPTEQENPTEPESPTQPEDPTAPETPTQAEDPTAPEQLTEPPTESDAAPEEIFEIVYNNPLFGEGEELEEVEVTDLVAVEAALSEAGEVTYHTSLTDLAADMRTHMVERENEFAIGYRSDRPLSGDEEQILMVRELIKLAVVHNGKPNEGDYLKWHYHSIYHTFLLDHNETEGVYDYTILIHPKWDEYDTIFDTSAAEEAEVDTQIAALRAQLFTAGMSDYDKAYAAAIYIIDTVTYGTSVDGTFHHYNCYGALVDHRAVCQGYALLFYRLMLEEGIDCRVITGWPSNRDKIDPYYHAWNIVRLNGVYYNLDLTWEDEFWDENKPALKWFLRCDANFTDHDRDDGAQDDRYIYAGEVFYAAYPMGKTDYTPAGPAITAVHGYQNGLSLSWNSVAGVQRYYLWRWIPADPDTDTEPHWENVTGTDKTTLLLSGLSLGDEDRYCVTGERADGTMLYHTGEPVDVIYDVLDTPILTGAACVDNGVKVTWQAVSGAECYRVYYKGTGGWMQAGTTTGTSYTVTGLSGGRTYRFTVRCVSKDNRYTASYYDSEGVSVLYYPAPKLTGVSATGTGVQVSWSAVSGAERYRVFYRKSGGSWKTAGDTTARTLLVKGLTDGERYDFTVRCLAANGKTPAGAYDKTGLTLTPAATPVLTGAQSVNGGVKVTWKKADGAAQYRVYYKTGSGGWKNAGTTKKTFFTVTGLTGGKFYTFTVRCISDDGRYNASGYDSRGRSLTYIAAPVLTGVQSTKTGVLVKWKASSGAERYKISYKADGGSWKSAGTTTRTGLTVTGLTSGKHYTFTVRCVSADGKQYTSGYDSKGRSLTYLSAPVLTGAQSVNGGVKVTWKQVTGAARYRVYYRTGSGGWKSAGTTNRTSFTVTGLTGGRTYRFTVRCVSADGKTFTSAYDTTGKSALYLTAPVLRSAVPGRGQVRVSWSPVTGASQYRVLYRTEGGKWTTAGDTTAAAFTVRGLTRGETYQFTVRCLDASGRRYASGFDATGLSAAVK